MGGLRKKGPGCTSSGWIIGGLGEESGSGCTAEVEATGGGSPFNSM